MSNILSKNFILGWFHPKNTGISLDDFEEFEETSKVLSDHK